MLNRRQPITLTNDGIAYWFIYASPSPKRVNCTQKCHLNQSTKLVSWNCISTTHLQNVGHFVLILKLTHWGRVTHICVGKLTIIGSNNGLSPGRRQAIIWTNAGILLIGPLRTNFSEILSEINSFIFKKMHLKMSSAKLRPFCFGLNVLINLKGWK